LEVARKAVGEREQGGRRENVHSERRESRRPSGRWPPCRLESGPQNAFRENAEGCILQARQIF
jgi:hypothetical protein